MLTQTGYLGALGVYVLCALLALALANAWLLRSAGAYLKVLLTLPFAAILLTPAYTAPDAQTLAPALVVTAFEWLSAGPEAAEHALRPLLVFTGLSLGLAVLLCAAVFLRRRSKSASGGNNSASNTTGSA